MNNNLRQYVFKIETLKDLFNNYEDKNEAIKTLLKFLCNIKYNDIFIIPSKYLDKNYRLSQPDVEYIVYKDKWNELKDINLSQTNNYALHSYFSSLDEETMHIYNAIYKKNGNNFITEMISFFIDNIDINRLDLRKDEEKNYYSVKLHELIRYTSNYILMLKNKDNILEEEKEAIENILTILTEKAEYMNYESYSDVNKRLLNFLSLAIEVFPKQSLNLINSIAKNAFLLSAEDYIEFVEIKEKYINRQPVNIESYLKDLNTSGKSKKTIESVQYKYHTEVIIKQLYKINDSKDIDHKFPYLQHNIIRYLNKDRIQLLLKDIEGFHSVMATYDQNTIDIIVSYEKNAQLIQYVVENILEHILLHQDHKKNDSVENIEKELYDLKKSYILKYALENNLEHKNNTSKKSKL